MINVASPFYFISYAHSDSEKVKPIINYLIRKGFNIWYDAGIVGGSEWQQAIGDALSQCKGVIAFLSVNFNASKHCKREIAMADDYGKSILPVYLSETNLSNDLKYILSRTQAVFKYKLSDIKFYQELLSLLGATKKPTAAKTAPAQPQNIEAPLKDKYNKALSYLASGKPLYAIPILKDLSEQNYHEATSELADMYLFGNGVQKDLTQAIELHSKACKNKVLKSYVALGTIYLKGLGIKIDKIKALEYFQTAAKLGDVDTALKLARWYSSGENVIKDNRKSLKFYEHAAKLGSTDGMFMSGECFSHGVGVKKDLKKAYEYYAKGAKLLHPDCLFMSANCNYNGIGVERNLQKAIQSLEPISFKKFDKADLLLGEIYDDNNNAKLAYKSYSAAAALGNFTAKLKLADCLQRGHGTTVNYERAAALYSALAGTGNAEASLKYAICLHYGYGIQKDENSAFKLISDIIKKTPSAEAYYYCGMFYLSENKNNNPSKAADNFECAIRLGDKRGELELGKLHYSGALFRANYSKAFELFKSAAQGAILEASCYLGICYFHGFGTQQNYALAYSNLEKSKGLNIASGDNLLGLCYYYGKGTDVNHTKAYRLFLSAYKKQHRAAACNTSICLLLGRGVQRDVKRAVATLEANKNASVECMFALAQCYEYGIGTAVCVARSEELYLALGEFDYQPANDRLAELYKKGGATFKKSRVRAVKHSSRSKNTEYLTEAIILLPTDK